MANTIRDNAGAKYVEMQNGRFARKPIAGLFDGGAWNKIRVAVWCRSEIVYTTTPTGTPRFRVGLCSGTTNIPGDATPTNAIGVSSNSASWSGYNTGANTVAHYFAIASIKIVAGVETYSALLPNNSQGIMALNNTMDAGAWMVDITRGSPNFTVGGYIRKGINASGMTPAQFESESILATPTHGDLQATTPATVAFSEADGTLDSAFIHWDQSYLMRVLNWRVIRLA